MKKILVPVDFSDASKHAAEFAVDLASKSGAEIIMFHSMHFNYFPEYPYSASTNFQSIMDDVFKSVEERMEKFLKGYEGKAKIKTKISQLHLLEAVKDIVKEENIGLLIMGTSGCSGWSELLVGSNTERIVRWVDCPVISVPSSVMFEGINKIMVPVDLRELQDEFLKKLVNLQKLFSCEMEFLWVKTPHNIENDDQVITEFANLTDEYGFKDVSFTIAHNVFPTDGILERASETNINMVAMATHARRGISHWLSGSITEDTVNHVKVPVWSFKLDKSAKNIELQSFKKVHGVPTYRNIEMMFT